MDTLVKIADFSNELSKLTNLIDGIDNSNRILHVKVFDMVYSSTPSNEIVSPSTNDSIKDLGSEIIDEIDKAIKLIIENFNPQKVWLVFYTPNSGLDFHYDNSIRYILPINTDEKFYYYELVLPIGDDPHHPPYGPSDYCNLYSKKIKELPEEEFNQKFVSDGNRILKLEPGCVYTYVDSVGHTVLNRHKTKIRCSIVFDLFDKPIPTETPQTIRMI